MANYTPNYQLHQWEPEDKFLRTDFNQDLSKIDTALDTLADKSAALEAAVALCGNCQIVSGSYVGNGKQGQENPITFSFEGKPMFVVVLPERRDGSNNVRMVLVRDSLWTYSYPDLFNSISTVSWGGTFVSWWSHDFVYLLNETGKKYCYVALLER